MTVEQPSRCTTAYVEIEGFNVQALGWSPRWNSFEEFMASGAQDWYTANADAAERGAGI